MANLDTIKQYNDGALIPNNYEETYLATRHVQDEQLIIENKIVDKLKSAVEAEGLYFDDEDIFKEIVAGLLRGNIILQGPPGTGKTTLAAIICRVFKTNMDVVTAVSDWTTYDTIGGYQPAVDDEGNEIITGKNGRVIESVKNCCETILKNKHYSGEKQATWLVIDELNRCEIDKVFGDLFTAFGSDKAENRKIPLWFNDDFNKKIIYVPQRFRIIGLMNNFDKNFVFDLSHGLARRFTIISVLPPVESKFTEEIKQCKEIIAKEIPVKMNKIGSTVIDETQIKSYFTDSEFVSIEQKVSSLLKQIRYAGENNLNLQYGTAQIIDFYENIIIQMILDDYASVAPAEKASRLEKIVDSAFNSRIVPQLDGIDYLRLKKFYQHIQSATEYAWLTKSIKTISELV